MKAARHESSCGTRSATADISALCPLVLDELRQALGAAATEQLLRLFVDDLKAILAELISANSSAQHAKVKFLAHKMKGACLQFGAHTCAMVIDEMERVLNNNNRCSSGLIDTLAMEILRVRTVVI